MIIDRDFWRRLIREIKNLIPLFRYLILQTETHAFCLALAGATLLGFFPSCLVMLAVFKNILKWQRAYLVLLDMVGTYLPTNDPSDVAFIVRNLNVKLSSMKDGGQIT